MTERVTLADLDGACAAHRVLFEAEFPDGAEVTIENVHRARAARINLAFADNLIPAARRGTYAEAMGEARRATWAAFREARDRPEPDRLAAEHAARVEYERVHAKALVAALSDDGRVE